MNHQTPPQTPREAALSYLSYGWSVIPIRHKGKIPFIKWQPYQTVRPMEAEVLQWFETWPDANVAVVTGRISRLVVLDVDEKADGAGTLHRLIQEHGSLPDTPEAITGGGGRHVLFRHPGNQEIPSRAGALGPGLDIRGDGGYAVLPPSAHASGNHYTWVPKCNPGEMPLAELPEWMLCLLEKNGNGRSGANRKSSLIPVQKRNDTLTRYAGKLRRGGMNEEEMLATLLQANSERCEIPLSENEVAQIAHSVARYEPVEGTTDLDNARRFVTRYGQDVRYVSLWGKWLVWDGKRWHKDNTEQVMHLAKMTVRALHMEASGEEDERRRRDLTEGARRTKSAGRIDAMIRLAQSEPDIPLQPGALDADPWLLTVENGTLNLRMGELRPHRRGDLITKLAPVRYDADARCPRWEAFLNQIVGGNGAMVRYLQKAFGYALTGSTREQCFFILYGTGANGKSTLLNTARAVYGEYGQQARTEAFLIKRDDTTANDLARLHGARFVTAIEAEDGRRLAEARVKQITGGDPITARFLFQEFFTFEPTFKLFLATNHKPIMRGTDYALWRRVHLIPFEVTIPEPEQDRDLGERLKDELPGILRWMVEGCLAWQREGLRKPPEVAQATEGYRAEQDVLAHFLADCCMEQTGARITRRELYAAYGRWCQESGERQVTEREFCTRLRERGWCETKVKGVHHWTGWGLITEARAGGP